MIYIELHSCLIFHIYVNLLETICRCKKDAYLDVGYRLLTGMHLSRIQVFLEAFHVAVFLRWPVDHWVPILLAKQEASLPCQLYIPSGYLT